MATLAIFDPDPDARRAIQAVADAAGHRAAPWLPESPVGPGDLLILVDREDEPAYQQVMAALARFPDVGVLLCRDTPRADLPSGTAAARGEGGPRVTGRLPVPRPWDPRFHHVWSRDLADAIAAALRMDGAARNRAGTSPQTPERPGSQPAAPPPAQPKAQRAPAARPPEPRPPEPQPPAAARATAPARPPAPVPPQAKAPAPHKPPAPIRKPAVPTPKPSGPLPAEIVELPHRLVAAPPQVLAIGISTGGPGALGKLLPALDPACIPPIVIVQHIPPEFVPSLAQRLDDTSRIQVHVAEEGQRLEPGHAYIAQGARHLTVRNQGRDLVLHLSDNAPVAGHRPSVDVLYSSLASHDIRTLPLMMTGMGQDGAVAMLSLRDRGAFGLGQDERTSVVYGMPRVAHELGAVDLQLPLERLGPWLNGAFRALRMARPQSYC